MTYPFQIPKYQVFRAFGCRSPETNQGKRDGSFIAMEFQFEGGPSQWKSVVFEKGKDYIGHPKSMEEVSSTFHTFMSKHPKWQCMTREDIEKTSGVKTGDDTDFSLPFGILNNS